MNEHVLVRWGRKYVSCFWDTSRVLFGGLKRTPVSVIISNALYSSSTYFSRLVAESCWYFVNTANPIRVYRFRYWYHRSKCPHKSLTWVSQHTHNVHIKEHDSVGPNM
jgi:hypothetical protein